MQKTLIPVLIISACILVGYLGIRVGSSLQQTEKEENNIYADYSTERYEENAGLESQAKIKAEEKAKLETEAKTKAEQQIKAQSQETAKLHAEQIAQLEAKITELLKTNTIHSVNVEDNEARIDPLIWCPLPIETKQQFVLIFSHYFELKGSTGRVTILSNRNDKKLASFSSWTGIKIYE